ncbi:MAG: alpha-N-acetylglucosaminidase [Akkermansiaceae bacterium]|nr:alpha-N-acetylglucosaminidase [Akkermansiaceae bacterium]
MFRHCLITIVSAAATLSHLGAAENHQVPEASAIQSAAEGLVKRVVAECAGGFVVEVIPADAGKNVFEVESKDGKIVLRGDNGVSIASALNYYLKKYAQCHLSWCGDQLDLPDPLPTVPAKERVVNPHRYRVMFNYCTYNYTCSWWGWERWERELDFLAMNGINTPLGVLGIEAVWYNTLLKHGFSDAEARAFLVGPAYFAWQWMTNIEGHCGPLPKSWIDARVQLGKLWFARARALGMTPIRQGFSGNVPRLLKEKMPKASIALQPPWCGFTGSAQLDPTDPFFKKIGKTFLEENIRLFGAEDHLWAADPFHESEPPQGGSEYLDAVGKTIFALMQEVDPQAIWAMQAWSIREHIACAVPKGKLLVLDLGGGRNNFWGHDFVKGQLHNFGGRINLHGDLRDICSNRFAAAAKEIPQCKGMGLFPEAIMQNPVFYDCVFDMIWRDAPAELENWLDAYTQRRYGSDSANAKAAWKILSDGPYRRGTSGVENSSMIAARPALSAKKSGPNNGFAIPYEPQDLVAALDLLLKDADKLGNTDTYRYDVVDIMRQILSNYAQVLHREIREAYQKKDKALFKTKTAAFYALLEDADRLLATRSEFLFGKWLADARACGTSPEEKALYAHNAAMLVTLWGPDEGKNGGEAQIFDYSWREWSGLISRYYLPRWQKFYTMLESSIEQGNYQDPGKQVHGRESLRANAFYAELATWEIAFAAHPPRDLPAAAHGDPVAVTRALFKKYRPHIHANPS